ncbi:MAG: DUF4347 domain-containing protein [Okeania sp. SIO3B5]|uniref:DUF4347 domain-containing protein n=1 Tax=Okeania sp. SIO3B5 TaxID=2607811 RepID=UPI0013FF15B1|nr:DUF4347 domain-containing protein [Okeania sp. SIO3B5]NEO55453.1 DUF4347 domain-containing protein [Okeania sp. SIO3B5]
MNQTKLLFIDSKVENYHHLIPEVDLKTRIVILQPNQNGIEQISQSLGECSDVETIHIISHGAKNTLYLGNSILNLNNIHQYAESIQQWGKCLSASGEILIYGCQVASGKEGKEFVLQLHQLTGANIAASETLTGNVSKGGNWNLEVIFGQLKSALAFTPEVRTSYPGVLANIVVDTTDDVVDDSDGVTSLREAIIEANSTPEDDTIQLTAGATYNLTIAGSDDVAATGDLDIVAGGGETTVISEGGEQAVIDAGGMEGLSDRVFHVLEDAALQLENLEITRGFVNNRGGGISNSGTLTISDSTISGNSASSFGGGVYNRGTLTISDSTISSNSASSLGGGVDNFFGRLTISNSTISGNSASYFGGGVNNIGTLTISDSTISDNSATNGGGGIYNSETLTISNSTISSNSASYFGGGVNNRGTLTISDSTVSGNSGTNGGGIFNFGGSTVSITNSTISNNSVDGTGGGIDNLGTVSIRYSVIFGNDARLSGDGVSNSGTASISNSTISNNFTTEAISHGINNSGTVDINNSSINNNNGGIFNSGTASISNSAIIANTGAEFGAGINNSGTATISNSAISLNSASFGSGGINNEGTVSINNSSISVNDAQADGGIGNSGTATINNSTIRNNSAPFQSGGIGNSGTVTINNSTISGNLGHGIYNLGTASISNSTITRNEDADEGSGILSMGFDDSDFIPSTTLTSSIVSGNVNTDFDSTGSNNIFVSGGNNLIGTGNAINNFNSDNDQTGVTDPLLGDLYTVGFILTHVPLSNSPAIDAGSNPNNLDTDQRGEARFVGEGVDIGAVELQAPQEITGTPESEFLDGTIDNATIIGLAGNDTINGRGGDDRIIGSRGNDFLFGTLGNDTLQGRQGSDHLFGGIGNDSLLGGQGRDRLNGGISNDTLTGGAGIDRFIFNTNREFTLEGVDTITDFTPGRDIILLDKSTFTAITSDSGVGFSVNIEFAIITSDAEAETSEAFIVYNSNNGKLFYNANGTDAEFGNGGEFANLTNAPSISEDDFLLRG